MDPDNIVDFMNESMERERTGGWSILTRNQQIASCVSVLRFNLEMGGLSGYLYNRDDIGRAHDINAIREIKAPRLASVLERANVLLAPLQDCEEGAWGESVAQMEPEFSVLESQLRKSEFDEIENLLITYLQGQT
jgi:hypothetical protein